MFQLPTAARWRRLHSIENDPGCPDMDSAWPGSSVSSLHSSDDPLPVVASLCVCGTDGHALFDKEQCAGDPHGRRAAAYVEVAQQVTANVLVSVGS